MLIRELLKNQRISRSTAMLFFQYFEKKTFSENNMVGLVHLFIYLFISSVLFISFISEALDIKHSKAGYKPVDFVKSLRMSIPVTLYYPFELSALMKVIDVWGAGGASPKGATEFDSVFLA